MSHSTLDTPGGPIAYHKTNGDGPTIVFCGGFMSDMEGSKAVALEAHAKATGRPYVRFDYRGHGSSSGTFRDLVISAWLADTLHVLDEVAGDDILLIGSSMGGWIALQAALARKARVKGLILIAPAPEFTQRLMEPSFSAEERAAMARDGFIAQPTDYGPEPYIITQRLIDDGKTLGLLHAPIELSCPVRILHGQQDTSVPWDLSLEIADTLATPDVVVTFVKEGDHSFSGPEDLVQLLATVDGLLG
ncbi:MAG: alpha/beta fold hydrolase [Sphingomonadales bacterium]